MGRLAIKVAAKASRDEIRGWQGDTLRVAVAAAPERGRANAAVEALLARALALPAARVRVVSGHTAARKSVEITGIAAAALRERLDAALATGPV